MYTGQVHKKLMRKVKKAWVTLSLVALAGAAVVPAGMTVASQDFQPAIFSDTTVETTTQPEPVETTETSVDLTHNFSVHSPYTLMKFGKGVCQAYAGLFIKFTNQIGINSTYVTGSSKNPSNDNKQEGHAWNKVEIDGKWYNIDLTWDDPKVNLGTDPVQTGSENYKYFLKSDATFASDHQVDSDNPELPAANEDYPMDPQANPLMVSPLSVTNTDLATQNTEASTEPVVTTIPVETSLQEAVPTEPVETTLPQ